MLQRSYRFLKTITQPLRQAWREPDAVQRWHSSVSIDSRVHASIEFLGLSPDSSRVQLGKECELLRDLSVWLSDDPGSDSRLTLGNRVYIARNCFIGCYLPISIGDNTQLGAYCYVISANHRFERRDVPIRDQGFTGAPVVIGADVWLGTHVTVLAGAVIEQGAIVGAGSVVTGKVPAYEIWGGVPAKFIKVRPG